MRLFALLALFLTATDGPEAVIEALYRAADRGQVEQAQVLVRPEDQAHLDAAMAAVAGRRAEHGPIQALQTGVLDATESRARVHVVIQRERGREIARTHTLVRRDGRWLLAVVPPPPGETPAPLPPPEGPPEPLHLVNRQAINPYNAIHVPRPNPGAEHVSPRTDFFAIVGTDDPADRVDPDSITITLRPAGGEAFPVLSPGQSFPEGYQGRLFQQDDGRYGRGLAVYVDPERALTPDTVYTITVRAESERGMSLPVDEGAWRFTTASAPDSRAVDMAFNLAAGPDVTWNGQFFNGLGKSSFTTSAPHRLPQYELIARAQEDYPDAWNLQRDAYLAGFEHQPVLMKKLPNIVRERETRRIVRIVHEGDEAVLHVADFFGHEQYGIESGRPVEDDYRPGNEILIADGVNSARARVHSAGDGTVRVTTFADPADGWKIEYSAPLPREEDPNAPGLFPPGGTYLRKFDPVGTPRYYWGRLNHEWDIVHDTYGRRVIPRFTSAIGCLSIDGGSGTTAKDLAQHHEVTRRITSHLIGRYGDATLEWPWVILNEPDLMSLYWRNKDWEELQRFYDYTADAILRAFEDHGYDSARVNVGGLELGAIWGAEHLRLDDFLIHCSPNATGGGALANNAAYADPRLDGKRSARVERLCRANEGRGAPLDFLSIHSYNTSDTAAAKLIAGKRRALEIDPAYYETLPVVSHETVPTWRPILDPGAAGMYLDNGYFTSWMADFQARLLHQGARDPRYAHGGELLLMHWPGIVSNFDALNDTVRKIHLADRTEVIPTAAFHFVNLLSTMGDGYWVFPEEVHGGHTVSGFASRTDEAVRAVVYAHHHEDTASRSEVDFDVTLTISGLPWDRVSVVQYRFDKDHNSCYRLARKHRRTGGGDRRHVFTEAEFARVASRAELRTTESTDRALEDGALRLEVPVAANGANVVFIRPRAD